MCIQQLQQDVSTIRICMKCIYGTRLSHFYYTLEEAYRNSAATYCWSSSRKAQGAAEHRDDDRWSIYYNDWRGKISRGNR